jgi:hypothetical protein
MIGKFFHTPGTKQFGFRPRYYDPDKEDLDNRIERIKEDMGMTEKKTDNGKPFVSNIKGQFRNPDAWQKSSPDARKAQNKRLIYLVIILGLIFFMFFYF